MSLLEELCLLCQGINWSISQWAATFNVLQSFSIVPSYHLPLFVYSNQQAHEWSVKVTSFGRTNNRMIFDHVSLQTVKLIACCSIFRQFSSKNRCGLKKNALIKQLMSIKHVFHSFWRCGF